MTEHSPPPSPPSSPPLPPPPSPPPPHVDEEVGENELDLRHVLDQFTQTMTTALQERQNTEASDIKRVMEFGAYDFFGNAYPAEAENWLTDIERVFEVLQCPDEDRVWLAAFLLKRNAYHWWKTVRRGYADPTPVTWADFQHVLYEQFYLLIQQCEESRVPASETEVNIPAVVTATTYPTIRALAQAVDRVSNKHSEALARRHKDSSGFGGPSQGPS
ncbi:hypothetical protein L3X38_018418 [Prunus dulcis]|uniref:Retrotransposon gag domain-containing protein n=1 Tax=Prunus dulcis TaxID=3755 RepID=A0AAD4W9P5_PRUDU|nr:hypothetical protein L3X38_018418 [Prunus dulcis]